MTWKLSTFHDELSEPPSHEILLRVKLETLQYKIEIRGIRPVKLYYQSMSVPRMTLRYLFLNTMVLLLFFPVFESKHFEHQKHLKLAGRNDFGTRNEFLTQQRKLFHFFRLPIFNDITGLLEGISEMNVHQNKRILMNRFNREHAIDDMQKWFG